MNTTAPSNQTTLSAGEEGGEVWGSWDVTIGINDAIFILLGFSIGSLATAVCFMATRRCKGCKKNRDDDDEEV